MSVQNLSRHFLEDHPLESAKVLETFPVDGLAGYFELLPIPVVANLLRYFLAPQAVACLLQMPLQRSASVIEHLGVDVAARFLRRMDGKDQLQLLNAVSGGFSARLRAVLRYPLGTVGQHMSPNIFLASETMIASEVFGAARNATSEIHGDIFIVDANQRLVGLVDVKNLVFADAATKVQQIMRSPDVVLNARTSIEQVKDHPKWQFREVLPVADHHTFVGVLKRSVLQDVVAGDQFQARKDVTVMDTLFEVADIFWEICINIVLPGTGYKEGRQK